ncbi:hypothetical protein J6590_032125 [Homalodisca vitripennis]|nr:hypothetical protein J6590_032125 [Homalodisca vitripennis]
MPLTTGENTDAVGDPRSEDEAVVETMGVMFLAGDDCTGDGECIRGDLKTLMDDSLFRPTRPPPIQLYTLYVAVLIYQLFQI